MAGTASSQLRSAFVVETVPGTTPATPAFKTLHTPALFTGEVQRFHQSSLVAGGADIGDAATTKPAVGKISNAPIVAALYDPILESLLQATFSTNVLLDGKARQTMSFENMIPAGIGGAATMMRYVGVEAVAGVIQADARGKVTFSADLIGMASADATTTAITGATYTDPVNNDPFASNGDLGAVTFAGFTLDGIASLTINLTYTGRDIQPVIGGDILAGIARGALTPTITLKCYADSNFMAAYNAARVSNQTAAKLTVNLGSVTGKKYRFEFWNCYTDAAPMDFSGNNAFVTITLNPAYSQANTGVLTLTRAL